MGCTRGGGPTPRGGGRPGRGGQAGARACWAAWALGPRWTEGPWSHGGQADPPGAGQESRHSQDHFLSHTRTSTAHRQAITTALAHAHTRTRSAHTHPHPIRTADLAGLTPQSQKKVKQGFGPWGPSLDPWPQRGGGGSLSPGVRTKDPKARVPAPQAPGLIPGRGIEGRGAGGGRPAEPGTGAWGPLASSPRRRRGATTWRLTSRISKRSPWDLSRN